MGCFLFLKKKTDGLTTGLFRLSICVLSFLLLQAKNSTDEWLYIGFVRREGVPKSLRVLHRLTGRRSPLAHLSDKALNGSGSLLIGFVALTGASTLPCRFRAVVGVPEASSATVVAYGYLIEFPDALIVEGQILDMAAELRQQFWTFARYGTGIES